MRVLGVQMRDFRNYSRAEAVLGAGLTVVHGANGAGKSNLLEALYFGCTSRSQRTRSDRELVRFGAAAARVTVTVRDEEGDVLSGVRELGVAYGSVAPGEPAVKRVTFDGAAVERLDADTRPLLGVFQPDRLELVKGPAAVRRAHLDQLVAAIWPQRAGDRREFGRVLAQRNALLARIRSGRASRSSLEAWDRELARTALAVGASRARAVALVAAPFATLAAQLGCSGCPQLEYRPRSSAADGEQFIAELQARLGGDIERGVTSHGPHRDELAIVRDGRTLRAYGSQGEQRIALLALLLAERSVLASERGQTPLMLLDDVMSELDGERRQLLTAELSGAGQSVIATADIAQVPGACEASSVRLLVSAGTILQEALAA